MGFFSKKKKENEMSVTKKQKAATARTVQELLNFLDIEEDGIVKTKSGFSKLYKVEDANFVTEPEEKQEDILVSYSKLINRFPENIETSIIIVNKRNSNETLAGTYHIKEQGDKYDEFRDDYNKIIDEKIADGHNDISKVKYIMLNCRCKSLNEAHEQFTAADLALQESVRTINKIGAKQLDAIERLKLMHDTLNGAEGISFEKEYERFFTSVTDGEGNTARTLNKRELKKRGMSIKDMISPQVVIKEKSHLFLDKERYCKGFAYRTLPLTLDTSFLTNSTNLPYEMVTVLQFKTVPRKAALRMVKVLTTSVKADLMKAHKQLIKSGLDPSLVNDELQATADEAARLRDDVVRKGKKLFFATMVVTIFGKSEEELNLIEAQFKSKCEDYTVTPSYLYGQQTEALNTSILVGTSPIINDRLVTSDDLCALQPWNIQELQDKGGHFYGINAISKNMIMYKRKTSKLANGLVFGQSGSGKSFITKGEIIPNLLDGMDDMIILDPENEYRIIAEKFGGTIIDLETNSNYHINPCDMSMEWNDAKAAPLVEKADYMVSLVESILGQQRSCNPFEVNVIHRASNKMYEPYVNEMRKRYRNGDKRDIDTTIMPTLKDFYQELLNDNSPEGNKIAMAIEPYCVGNYSLFAHRTNIESKNRLTVFNLLYLPEKMKEMAMKVCLANIWTRIVKNKEDNDKYHTGKGIWVYLDEFHLFFQTESSATTIMTYYKRVRKYGGIMTGITQDVADLLKTSQGTAMFNNSGFFIFLNQSPIGRNQLQNLYQISDSLIDYLKDKPSGVGLIYNNSVVIPFDYKLPNNSKLYEMMSTNPNDEFHTKQRDAEALAERERRERERFEKENRNNENEDEELDPDEENTDEDLNDFYDQY